MGYPRWCRSVGTLAAVAALAASATYAHAQSEISLKTITPASAPGSSAVVRIVDDANPGNEVTRFQFNIFYDSSETSPTLIAGIPGETDNGFIGITGPYSTPAGDQLSAGLDKYVTVDGEAPISGNWIGRGALADVTIETLSGYTGSMKLDIAESPFGQPWNYMYIDSGNNTHDNLVTYGTGTTTSYGNPVIVSIDHEGTWLNEGDTVTVTGSGFFNDGAGPAPDTVFTYNGETLDATINSPTEAVVTIPAFTALPGSATEYADLPLKASNGTGFTDDEITYTLVSQDKVYVDDDWAGAYDPHMRLVTGRIAGGNAFANIQPAVNAVNAGQTVEVASGTYAENNSAAEALLISKPLSLLGPNTGTDGNDSRSAEALIVPAVQLNNDDKWSDIPVVNVTSSDVTIDGFSISGDNENVDGLDYAGLNLEAGTGILSTVSNLTFSNNILSDLSYVGLLSFNQNNPTLPSHDNVFVTNNKFVNITDNETLGYGMAVYMQASNGKVNDNTFENCRMAMQIQPYRVVADGGEFAEVTGNTIEAWRGGIYYNYAEDGASPWTISGNSIVACNPPSTFAGTSVVWEGIAVETMRDDSNGGLIDNNTIDGATAQADAAHDNVGDFAEAVWGMRYKGKSSLSTNVQFTNNTVSNVTLGFVHDAPADTTLTGNTFTNFTDDAIRLQVTYGSTGVPVDGNSSEAGVQPFGGTGNVDATGGNVYAAVNSTGATLDQLYDIEDVITHKVDDLAWGLVRVVPENIYVTQESNSIQRGVDAATGGDGVYAGDTIHVQAGTYAEAKDIGGGEYIGLDVNKQVTLLGPNAGTAGVGSRAAEAVIVPGAYLNQTSTMDPGPRISDWHPVVYLHADGIVFSGFAVSGENSSLTGGEGPAVIADLSLAASTGITAEANNITISDNNVDSFSYIGVWVAGYLSGYPAWPQFDGVHVADNLVSNVHSSDGFGHGYYIAGAGAVVENNVANNVRSGMNIQPYDMTGSAAICRGNHLNAWYRGLWFNYSLNNTANWQFSDNHVTAAGFPTGYSATSWDTSWTGLVTQTQYSSAAGANFTQNTVNAAGSPTGIPSTALQVRSSIPTPTDALVFEQNEVQGADIGVAITFDGTATVNGQATFQNNNEIHDNVVGIDIVGTSNNPQIITGNNIHDNQIGIRVRNGGIASINGNTLTGNAQQLAFEIDAEVNGYAVSTLDPLGLEAVAVIDNALAGKTYISAGMADTQGNVVAESVGGEDFAIVRNTIQGSVSAPANIAATNTVKVLPDSYRENVTLGVGTPVRLSGSGPGVTTIVGPHDGTRRAVYIRSASIVEGFTLTRDGNNAIDWLTNKLSETLTIGSGATNVIVQDNVIADGRSGVYAEGAGPGNVVRRNLITHNHTGMHLVDRQVDLTIENNTIVDNRTAGILFRGTGTGQTSNVTILDNNISGNWLGQIINRYAYSDVINASGNWLGETEFVAQDEERLESGTQLDPPYSTWMPDYYGGSATAPGNPLAISGAEHELVDYNAYLASAADSNASTLAFEGDFSELYIVADSPLAGTEDSHINDAVALLENGALSDGDRLIHVLEGTYEDGVATVDKPVQIHGMGATNATTVFNPLAAGQDGIVIAASDVTVENLAIAGDSATRYGTAVYRPNTGAYGNTTLNNLAVSYAGDFSTKKYAVDLRQPIASSNLVSTVSDVVFDNCDYAGLALFGGDVDVSGSTFTNMSYQGIYAAPAHAYPGSALSGGAAPVVRVAKNTFVDNPAAVRFNTVGAGSIVGGADEVNDANTFTVGSASVPGLGVSIEYTPATVQNNTFTIGDADVSGFNSIGVWVWGTEATVSDNTFAGTGASSVATGIAAVGQRVGPLAGGGSNQSNATDVTATGNSFTGLKAGVSVALSASANQAATVTVNGNNTFTSNHDGVLVDGEFATAAVSSNTFTNNEHGIDIAAATETSAFDDNTFDAIDTSTQKYIVNTSGNDYDVSSNAFDGVTPDVVGTAGFTSLFAISEGLIDAIDETGNGYLQLAENNVYVAHSKVGVDSSSNGVLTRAGLVADNGYTVNVEAGTYGDAAVNLDKHVMVTAPAGTGSVVITQPVTAELNDSVAQMGLATLGFEGNGTVTFTDAVAPNLADAQYGVAYSEFNNVAGTAVTVDTIVPSGSGEGMILNNTIANSGGAVLIDSSVNVHLYGNMITDCANTAVAINKTVSAENITPSDIFIWNNLISGSGHMLTETDPNLQNGEGYGIFAGAFGPNASSDYPASTNLSIVENTIASNAATGVALWYNDQDGSGVNQVYLNTIEDNGKFKIAEERDSSHNTDGLKLKNTKNITVSYNMIHDNARNNVLVEGNYENTGEGVVINNNHLEEPVPTLEPGGATLASALMLQITSPQAASTTVDANDNWWGHVYGPSYAANPTGRGDAIILKGGNVDVATWYGQQDEAHKWYALNDRDGDGVLDADEDLDLSNDHVSALWGAETGLAVKDSDGDGYEDGAEVACGSDPLNVLSTPADPNGDQVIDDAHPLATFAYLPTGNVDTDGDRYLDFYEVAQGTDPNDAGDKPSLGLLKPSLLDVNIGQVSMLRRILVGANEFTESNIEQDNGDVNRDGVVNNADLIFIRRHAASSTSVLPIVPTPVAPEE